MYKQLSTRKIVQNYNFDAYIYNYIINEYFLILKLLGAIRTKNVAILAILLLYESGYYKTVLFKLTPLDIKKIKFCVRIIRIFTILAESGSRNAYLFSLTVGWYEI